MDLQYKNILILNLRKIGDTIMATSSAYLLKRAYPKATITMLVKPLTKSIVENNPVIDEVLLYDYSHKAKWNDIKKTVNNIKSKNFDLAVIIDNKPRSALLSYLAKIPKRIGFEKITVRNIYSVEKSTWMALMLKDGNVYESPQYKLHVLEGVAGGDAFGAGLMHGLVNNYADQKGIDFAIAASVSKLTIVGDLNISSQEDIEEVMNRRCEYLIVNKDTIEVAKKLKEKGYHIYVLSNMAAFTYEYFQEIDFFKLCDGIMISAYEHLVKPDEKIFMTLLDRYHLKSEECLFIDDDDTGKSLETANRLGILGRRVKPNDSQDVLTLLKEYKIEI